MRLRRPQALLAVVLLGWNDRKVVWEEGGRDGEALHTPRHKPLDSLEQMF
jgi:hypothetical protein